MTREEQSALKEQRIRTIWEMILKEHLSVVEISKRLQVTRATNGPKITTVCPKTK